MSSEVTPGQETLRPSLPSGVCCRNIHGIPRWFRSIPIIATKSSITRICAADRISSSWPLSWQRSSRSPDSGTNLCFCLQLNVLGIQEVQISPVCVDFTPVHAFSGYGIDQNPLLRFPLSFIKPLTSPSLLLYYILYLIFCYHLLLLRTFTISGQWQYAPK